jgi:hypothetical protein
LRIEVSEEKSADAIAAEIEEALLSPTLKEHRAQRKL